MRAPAVRPPDPMNPLLFTRNAWLGLGFLVAALGLAWMGALQIYYPNGDEYLYLGMFDEGLVPTMRQHFVRDGLQRFVGYVWAVSLIGLPPSLIGPVCVAVHLIAVSLVFLTARVLTRNWVVAVFIAIVWGVYPLGYHAVLWSTGTYAVLHLSLVLAAFLILFRHRVRPFQLRWLPYALSGAALLIAGFIGEYLVFAFPMLGLLALTAVREYRVADWRSLVREPMLWWPLIVTVVFLALLAWSKPHGIQSVENPKIGDLNWHRLNPRSLLSVWYYQYTGVFQLQPWRQPGAFRVAFQTWTTPMLIAVVALAVAAVGLLRKFLAEVRVISATAEKPPLSLGVVLFGLLPCVSFVFVIAGGYTGDSRHNYIPSAFGLLFVGWVIARWWPPGKHSSSLIFPAALLVLAVAVVTNWLVVGGFRYETRRHQALIQFIHDQDIRGPVRILHEPALYHTFPLMPRTLSHGFGTVGEGWCFEWALSYLRTKRVPLTGQLDLSVTNAPGAPLVTIRETGPEFALSLTGPTNATARLRP